MILCIEVVNYKANPTCQQKDNDGDDFAGCADVHFEDFQNGLNAEDDTYDVDDFCDHNSVIIKVNNMCLINF